MKIEELNDILVDLGFRPWPVSDSGIGFKYEGYSYGIVVDPKDEVYIRIVFPFFESVEGKDPAKVASAALDATANVKSAKILILEEQVWGSVEFFLANPQGLRPIFTKCLAALQLIARRFNEHMVEE